MLAPQLRECPFCGARPELPSGNGSFYRIKCKCGMAGATVQIASLMTEAEKMSASFTYFRYPGEYIDRAMLRAIEMWNTRI